MNQQAADALSDPFFDSVRARIEREQPAPPIAPAKCHTALFDMEMPPPASMRANSIAGRSDPAVRAEGISTSLGEFLRKRHPMIKPK